MNKKTSPDDDLSASNQPLNGSVRSQIAGSSDAATPSGHQPEPSPQVSRPTTGVSVVSREQPSVSRKSTASLLAPPRRLPTADDYNQYMDNLVNTQEFVGNLESILGNCEVDDERDLNVDLIRDLVTYYLEPLRYYQNDILDIRNQITPSIRNAPEALVEMLTYFEPQFKSVVDKLDRMRKKIDLDPSTAESSSTDRNVPTSSEKPGVAKKMKQHQPEGFVATAQAGRKLEEWMGDIRSRKKDGKTTWRLDRRSDNFLQVVCDRYELAKDYELQRDLEILFEDETGSDQGAMIREFFQSAFQNTMDDKFKDTRLLIGDVGHVLPDTTDDYLTHAFTFIGKMIAHAVYNGCRGLPGLSHALQAYLVYGKGPAHIEELRPPVSIDDVWEPDLHEVLSKLQSGTDLTEGNRNVLQEWMNHSDCRIVHKPNTRHLIIQDLLIYYVFKRRMSQIEALAAGLDLFGLRQFLRENPTRENIAMVFPVPDDMVIPPYKPEKKDDLYHAFSSTIPELVREPRPRPRKKPEPSGVIATALMGRNLEEWANDIKRTKRGEKTKWRLDRHSILFLQMACEKYEKAKDLELRRDLEIIFEGEQGSDQGALTREFFYLAFQFTMENKYKDARLMLGEEGHVLPDATGEYLIHAFECIGKMIAHAVCNGCRGLPGLSPALQSYLVYGKGPAHIEELRPPVSIDDVCEHDLHEVLSKLESGENLTRENEAVLREWMDRSNCRIQLKHETRHLIIQDLLIYYVFKRRIGQIEALATGMDLFGLRQFLRENPTKENIATVFPSPADFVISPEMFMAVVITRGESYDPKIWEYFEQFLQDLAKGAIGGQSIADLVRFLSGSPYLPGRVVISFGEADVMPIAHACFNELQLPTKHDSYGTFREKMRDGIAHRDYALDSVDSEQQRLQDSLEIS